jgi:hypothetical protein
MKLWVRAVIQGASCGFALGFVVLSAARIWPVPLSGAAAQIPEVLRAKRFEVLDSTGRARLVLDLERLESEQSPRLALYGAPGKGKVELGVLVGLPYLVLRGEREGGAQLNVRGDKPYITLYDSAGQRRAELVADSKTGASLVFLNKGKTVWRAP